MISHFSGTVTAAGPTWVVLDNHGIGVKVLCPPATAASARVDQTMTLQTSLVVREDSLTLYGFVEADDRDAFQPSPWRTQGWPTPGRRLERPRPPP